MKPFTVPGLLRAAASYIEVHGHEQRPEEAGGLKRSTGPCCPVVAFIRIESALNSNLGRAACVALENVLPDGAIAEWSDRTPTGEVLATMRRVAAKRDGL